MILSPIEDLLYRLAFIELLRAFNIIHRPDSWAFPPKTPPGNDISVENFSKKRKRIAHGLWASPIYPMTYGMCGLWNQDPSTFTTFVMLAPISQGNFGTALWDWKEYPLAMLKSSLYPTNCVPSL
jgi:hypothetical protein